MAAMMAFGRDLAIAQSYPTKPIRMVTAAPGGNADFATRLLAQGLSASLGQPVIVENRPNGIPTYEIGARASPDGYTLLVAAENLWIGQFLQKVPYDPVRDFLPITLAITAPNVLVVYPPLPVRSVAELITLAKSKPGELNYASTGSGGSSHRSVELIKAMARIDIVHIPYKGTGPALNDLIGGRVQLMIPVAAAAIPHVKAGRVRALAVTSAEPSALVPGLPTVAASGLPEYEAVLTLGIFAPAKTPAAIINRLNHEFVQILNRPDVKEKFLNAGAETVGSSPGKLAATIKADILKWGKLIKDAGIRE
jgi:tripartite-type tricarboxylate transporter receptor subunit TctC